VTTDNTNCGCWIHHTQLHIVLRNLVIWTKHPMCSQKQSFKMYHKEGTEILCDIDAKQYVPADAVEEELCYVIYCRKLKGRLDISQPKISHKTRSVFFCHNLDSVRRGTGLPPYCHIVCSKLIFPCITCNSAM
jgi:hypothetical protein